MPPAPTRPNPLPAGPPPHPLTLRSLAAVRRLSALDTTAPAPGHAPPVADPAATAAAIALAAVEVLAGTRPVAQLARWVSPDLVEPLARRAALSVRVRGQVAARAEVLRVRAARLDERTVEATVVIADRQRVRAAAVRLEAHRGAWRAVALEIG